MLFGLDKNQSTWEQYLDYWDQLFHGDLGLSFTFFPAPVSEVIGDSLPWTLGLVGVTTIISFLLGTAARRRRRLAARLLGRRAAARHDVPVVHPVLLARPHRDRAARRAGSFFPSSGGYEPGLCPAYDQYFIPSAIQHSLLPALTISVSSVSGWILSACAT